MQIHLSSPLHPLQPCVELKQTRRVPPSSGVWGEAPAANDFGAFLDQTERFGAITIYHIVL